ncbi:hypothetical protein ACJRO7_015489 [Eucalyptus globulus]|uniref:Retrovirus-related Pol polyprotein from transposon TNT 1-94-like beta-barrel domain-containing protein n=1 Tax=Eucalyptus globulus TaxID=34317 RepID=A0ABD3L3R6_EUCGL
MISHGSSGCGARGRGYQGHGRGFIQSGSRGGRDRSIGSRGSRYCNHCWRVGHTEAHCYTLHPELRPTVAAFAEVEDSSSPVQPNPTNVQSTKDSVTLTRAEYEAWIRFQQVIGTSAPTVTLAYGSKGSSSCLLSTVSDSWVIDSGATHHIVGNSKLLSSLHSTPLGVSNSVTLADGSVSQVTTTGNAHLRSEYWTDDWWGT